MHSFKIRKYIHQKQYKFVKNENDEPANKFTTFMLIA